MIAANSRPRAWLVGLLALAILAISGAAVAYWSVQGSGAAAGSTGSTTAVTLTPGAPTTGLYPGGASDVRLSIANPNPTPITVSTIALDVAQGSGGFGLDTAHASCGVEALGFETRSNAGAGWTVPARAAGVDGVLLVTLNEPLTLALDALDVCQDATISVHLKTGT